MNTNQILTEEDSTVIKNALLDEIDYINNKGVISNAISNGIYTYLKEHQIRPIIMDAIERALCSDPEMYDAIQTGIVSASENTTSMDEFDELLTQSTKETLLNLKKNIESWYETSSLNNLRKTMVFSSGDPQSDIMIIGEAPGYDDERFAEPFIGKTGKKLDGILKAMGIDRKSVYTTNVLKYRPAISSQTTNDRKPTSTELESFLPFIIQEVEAVSPKVIIAVGNTVAQALLNNKNSMRVNRGVFHYYHGFPLCVTHDPSLIIHNEDNTTVKRMVWEDMLAVMDFLHLPISMKQRKFFVE